MLKLKNLERWGQVRTKKHAVIQTTSIMITEPNTHIHTVVMLKLKPEGVGAGQDKKHAVIQTTSIMIMHQTHAHTQTHCQ